MILLKEILIIKVLIKKVCIENGGVTWVSVLRPQTLLCVCQGVFHRVVGLQVCCHLV